MRPLHSLQSTPLPFTSGAIHNYLRNLLVGTTISFSKMSPIFLVGVRQQSVCLLWYHYPSATPLMVDVHYSDSVTYTYADTRERERDRGSSVYVDLYLLVGGMYKPKATKLSRREPD